MTEYNQDIKAIRNIVEKVYSIDISITCRQINYIHARMIFYKLCKDYTKYSLQMIGSFLSKDHATVLNGLRKYEILKSQDVSLFNTYNRCSKILSRILGFEEPINESEIYEAKLIKVTSDYENEIIELKRKLKTNNILIDACRLLSPEQQLEFYHNRFIPFAKIHKVNLESIKRN